MIFIVFSPWQSATLVRPRTPYFGASHEHQARRPLSVHRHPHGLRRPQRRQRRHGGRHRGCRGCSDRKDRGASQGQAVQRAVPQGQDGGHCLRYGQGHHGPVGRPHQAHLQAGAAGGGRDRCHDPQGRGRPLRSDAR